MIKINLLPPERRAGRRAPEVRLPRFNLGLLFLIVYLVAGGGAALYWWTLRDEAARLGAEVDRDQRELATLKAQLTDLTRVKAEAADMQKRVATITELTRAQDRPLKLLDAFLDAVPADLWVTSLEERGGLLKVTGTSYSTAAVSAFMANLRRSGKFKDVDILVARQDLSKTPSPVTFEITCRFEG